MGIAVLFKADIKYLADAIDAQVASMTYIWLLT